MANQRITKEVLAEQLSALHVGEGLEAKFYCKQGVKVVTFECRERFGQPEVTFRIGRKSPISHGFEDADNAWKILLVDNGLEPPKELVPIVLPENTRTKKQKPFVECEEMDGVLTEEQAEKVATMMLYAAEYDAGYITWPALHVEKFGDENIRMIVAAISSLCSDTGVCLDTSGSLALSNGLCQFGDTGMYVGDALSVIREKYNTAPIYTDRRANRITLYRGVWLEGNEKKINIKYINAYIPTGEYADKEKIDKMIERREREWNDDYPVNEGRLKAERQNRERIKDYNDRKDTFCHGIGQRRVKLFLNKLVKDGDAVAKMYRVALEIEGVNLAAKKALMKYHSDYHSYDRKEAMLRELMDVCKERGVCYGQQPSTAPAATHVIYFELPGCEQISFHTNMQEAETLPAYDGKWDGKRCSTMGKLESAIWTRYENALRTKYIIND